MKEENSMYKRKIKSILNLKKKSKKSDVQK